VRLLEIVNPTREPGRVTLITRYGAKKIEQHLAGHIRAVQESGHPVVWICDPMHGKCVFGLFVSSFPLFTADTMACSTHTSASGLKTRDFAAIVEEITHCLRIHTECGSRMGGVSLEFTGEMNEEGYRCVLVLLPTFEISVSVVLAAEYER